MGGRASRHNNMSGNAKTDQAAGDATVAVVDYAIKNPEKAIAAAKAAQELHQFTQDAKAGGSTDSSKHSNMDATSGSAAERSNENKGDTVAIDGINKSTEAIEDNCGSCGKKCGGCKRSFDEKISSIPLARFRMMLRACNVCAATLILTCVLLGIATLGIDSYSSFVLSFLLFVGGVILCALEMPWCFDYEATLRRKMKFIYYARGRAWAIILMAFLAFGTGWIAILIALFCILPYGLFSRYAIAIHPDCGDRLVTTQSAADVEAILSQGITIYDHYVVLDIEADCEEMSLKGVEKLAIKVNEITQAKAAAPVAAPVAAPAIRNSFDPVTSVQHVQPNSTPVFEPTPSAAQGDDTNSIPVPKSQFK